MTFDWTDSLSQFPVNSLRTVHQDASAAATRVATIPLHDDRRHSRRASRREYKNLLSVANAAKHLERLPEPGESIHLVMRGNYAGFDFVPATLRLAAPATIRELNIATLGFNQANAVHLLDLLDEGQIGRVTFLCSTYFRSLQDGADVYEGLHRELATRSGGHRIAAVRSHAKILLMELTDGQCITIESSANLRSCRNLEQCCITNDRELLEFHQAWMMEVLDRGEE